MKPSTNWEIFAEILLMIFSSKGENFCGIAESAVIKNVGTLLDINSFTFVQSRTDPDTVRKMRAFPKSMLYSVTTNPNRLDAIWSDEDQQKQFFEKRTIIVTKEKLNFTSVLEKLSGLHSVTWIVFVESLTELETAYIPMKVNFFTVHCTPEAIFVSKTYNIKPGLRFSLKPVQIWLKKENETLINVNNDKRTHFENAQLNFLYFSKEKECQSKDGLILDKIECFQQEVIKIIAERLNFTLNRILCPQRQYPYNFPNGTFSDMFLILQRGEADLSSGSYIISRSRLMSCSFVWPTFTTRSMMYIKFEATKGRWRAYLRPIDSRVWKAIISWIVVTGILLQIFEDSRLGNFKFRFSLIRELIQSVFMSLQVFCNQGLYNMPEWYSSRIVFMLTFLLFISLYQAYSGFLISSLTITVPDLPFTDVPEFFRDGTYKFMTLRRGFHNYFIKKILEEHHKKEEDILLKSNRLPLHTKYGVKILCSGRKISYVEFRENVVQNELPCKIIEIPKPILRQSLGLGLQKDSPYQKILTRQITVLRSTGILHRMKRYLRFYMKLEEREVSSEQYINVSFWHVVSIFVILGMGVVISLTIFFLEILWYLSTKRITVRKIRGRKVLRLKYFKSKKQHNFRNFVFD